MSSFITKELLTKFLLDFLHDVVTVNYTLGNEIDLHEDDYKELAEDYAELFDGRYKIGDN